MSVGEYVSLETICDGRGYIVRHHPNGGGYGSPWDFVVLAERTGGVWSLRAAWGGMTRCIWTRVRLALTAAGMPEVRWQRPRREVVVRAFDS